MKHFKIYLLLTISIIINKIGHTQTLTSIGLDISPSFTKLGYHHFKTPFAFAYGFGLAGDLRLNSSMFLRTGIGYKFKNELVKNVLDDRFIVDTNGNINYDNFKYFNANTKYYYWNLPILLNYKISKTEDKKISFYILGGAEINYLHKIKATAHLYDGDITDSSKPNKSTINLSFDIGGGLHFNISHKLMLSIEPKYCYDFYTSNDDLKFQSLQLNTGFYYKLL